MRQNGLAGVIETPQANLVTGMKWLLGVYTSRFNRRHKLFGHLFSGRYKSLIVDGSGSGYLKTVCDYVHLRPGAREIDRGRSAVGNISVEQLPAVFAPAIAQAALVADGPVIRRMGGANGQHGWAADVGGADGSAAEWRAG